MSMNYNNKKSTATLKKNNDTALFAIIFIICIIIMIVSIAEITWWLGDKTQKNLDKGCTPEAWGSLGVPTIWSCPVGVKIE